MSAPTLFVIAADLSQMQLNTSIDESDLGNVQADQAVTFRVDAYPSDTFRGTRVAGAAQPDDRAERGDLRRDHRRAEPGVEAEAGHDGER